MLKNKSAHVFEKGVMYDIDSDINHRQLFADI